MSLSVPRALPVLVMLIAAGIVLPASAAVPVGWQDIFPQMDIPAGAPSPAESFFMPDTGSGGTSAIQGDMLATGWKIEKVDPDLYWGMTTALALDATGKPRIAYDDWNMSSYPRVKYAWKDGSVWHVTRPKAPPAVLPDLALNAAGSPRISLICIGAGSPGSFRNAAAAGDPDAWPSGDMGGMLAYIWKTPTGWNGNWVGMASSPFLFGRPSLALAPTGNGRISYTGLPAERTNGLYLNYARLDDPWQVQSLMSATGPYVIAETQLALDRAGNPGIAFSYFDPGTSTLGYKYYWKDGSTWRMDDVADGIAVWSPWFSLARDASGQPRMTYFNANTNSLMYAWKSGGTWHRVKVDKGGCASSLAIDNDGNPRIVYLQEAPKKSGAQEGTTSIPGHVKYAYRDAGGWHTETVDTAGPGFVSIALDSIGKPSITYMNEDGSTLKYASLTRGSYMGRKI